MASTLLVFCPLGLEVRLQHWPLTVYVRIHQDYWSDQVWPWIEALVYGVLVCELEVRISVVEAGVALH